MSLQLESGAAVLPNSSFPAPFPAIDSWHLGVPRGGQEPHRSVSQAFGDHDGDCIQWGLGDSIRRRLGFVLFNLLSVHSIVTKTKS